MFTNKSGNLRGMNREANYRKATNNRQQNIDRNRTANRKAIGFGVIQLLFPFISSYFGNEAIRLAAEISEQDATNSVSVNSLYFQFSLDNVKILKQKQLQKVGKMQLIK